MRNVAIIGAWLMGIEAADVQMTVSILTGILVGVYTAMNTYVLWRDRVRKQSRPPQGAAGE